MGADLHGLTTYFKLRNKIAKPIFIFVQQKAESQHSSPVHNAQSEVSSEPLISVEKLYIGSHRYKFECSDTDDFQPPRHASKELWDRERKFWDSKDQKGLDNQKVDFTNVTCY